MSSLRLHRWWYRFLQWGGRADARPTEFAATVVSADRPGGADGAGTDGSAAHGASGAPDPAAVVNRIGRYLIKGRLGSGGLGEVFEAWDPLLSRAVAVKTLRLQLDPELRALLDDHILNEARAAAGLSHPNIVTVFDAGLCTPGVYIAMERLHGRDLRQALAQGWRPTPWQAAQLARRVAEALAYAHGKGVVHCDIKPGNIFLDAEDRPKVLDFGIARVAQGGPLPRPSAAALDTNADGGAAAGEMGEMSEGGEIGEGGEGSSAQPLLGSPHYLAPEQLQQGVADARTDVRALGVVLYEMLTGRKAFNGDSVEQVVNAVLFNHPAAAHDTRAGVPRGLSAIAARAMAREPERRHASAEDMARELRDWCDRHPEPAHSAAAGPGRAPLRAAATHQNRTTGWALAGLMLCAVTVGWLWWLSSGKPLNSQARQTPAPAAAAAATPAQAPLASAQSPVATTAAAGATPGRSTGAPSSATRAASNGKKPATASETAAAKAKRKASPQEATGTGAVLLSISPWGQVEVNGQPAGTTPPLSRLSLPAGRHTITVRNEDFPIFSTSVVVQADKPALVRHRFVQ